MTKINFAKSTDHDVFTQTQILAVGVYQTETEKRATIPGVCDFTKSVVKAVETLEAPTKAGSLTKFAIQDKLVYAVGLGELTSDELRQGAGAVARAAAGKDTLTIHFPHNNSAELAAIAEGALLGSYAFRKYLPKLALPISEITIISDLAEIPDSLLSRAEIITTAVNHVRDLTNLPANDLNVQSFTDFAVLAANEAGVKVKVYEEPELVAEKLAGLIAVGKGGAIPPRLVRLEWSPKSAESCISLVGKGITFDTGGYSLKPAAHMTEMKTDMCGAATVLETVIAAAKLEIPKKVVGWLCIAENMVSATATRPDDIIVYRNEKSVEINNTDAEGRLVMADGLLMACAENPDVVIDIATLTGAQMVALGERTTGIMGTAEIPAKIVAVADATAEPAWEMPLPKHLRESLESDVATLKNSGARYGGMMVAGLFLAEFVQDIPWAHIDIAGPSFNRSAAYGYIPKGGTGVMLRTLIQFIESYCD